MTQGLAAFIYCRTVYLGLGIEAYAAGIEAYAAGIDIPKSKTATGAFRYRTCSIIGIFSHSRNRLMG
jgi:hypothetical protein